MKTAIFIERDGILTVPKVDGGNQVVPATLEEFQLNRAAIPIFEHLKAAGFVLIVTTNQPGLSTGGVSRRELERMHAALRQAFPVDDIMVCPHDADSECNCRKPLAGLMMEAAFKWHLELERSYVISDKWQDARAARAVGCTSLLLQSPWVGNGHRDLVIPTLAAIASKIIQVQNRQVAA